MDIMPAEDTSDEAVEGESMKVKAICLWCCSRTAMSCRSIGDGSKE